VRSAAEGFDVNVDHVARPFWPQALNFPKESALSDAPPPEDELVVLRSCLFKDAGPRRNEATRGALIGPRRLRERRKERDDLLIRDLLQRLHASEHSPPVGGSQSNRARHPRGACDAVRRSRSVSLSSAIVCHPSMLRPTAIAASASSRLGARR